MTLRPHLFAAIAALGLAAPAARAEPPSGFTPAQRQEIVSILRDALKTDPTILGDAIIALRRDAEKNARSSALTALRDNRAALETGPAYTLRGNPSGDVTVVEFLDPRCGYCRAMVPVVDKLLAADSHVRLVEKVIPVLGEKSVLDAQAILAAARQGGYDKMKRALMLDKQEPSLDRVRAVASANGLDADKLVADIKDPGIARELNDNLALARAIGLDGTPTFIFGNSSVIPGAISLQNMQANVKAVRESKG
ncbi:DsbA family protein [Acidomonas methanolica]|uniref:Outer membrane protein n=1 Tax=Acidomonas methanolica NBRC 104435 TaxID=1231351 RepID=A0A023D498_ACIMT|nr:DsbA family protein [Acidomonas methanolica]MBU2654315.1 DsbA family protein [Acidomonas methanolica]TCS29246.1 protein-disulfide isomerase [Acidomonas methanolica]GAJ28957.1 outer membrane protein [Acidomonas methanolica NBRC 104435]GBQ56693.1 hypothetical protein AA0498_2415 [Acidomonas methanolica]GEK99268.1 DSBA oxidoreductase [Acidomonas methanolica NBRC 104435]